MGFTSGCCVLAKIVGKSPSLSLVTGKQVLTDSDFIYLVVTRKDNNRVELGQKAPVYMEIAPTWPTVRRGTKTETRGAQVRGVEEGAVARLLGTRKAPGKPGERPPDPTADCSRPSPPLDSAPSEAGS